MSSFVHPPVSLSIATAPITYKEDSVTITVKEDTATPADSKPLPVKHLDTNGRSQDFTATNEAKVSDTSTHTKLDTIGAKDFATQTTLGAVLEKIIAAPATEAKQDALIAAISAGNSVKKVLASAFAAAPTVPTATRYGTGVTVPASTTGLDLEILTKAGDNFTAYDASTGGNVIGRFTQAGGKIPCELAAGTTVYLQSDTGADFTASDLTINLIGA